MSMVDGRMREMLLVVVETFVKEQSLLRGRVVVDRCLPILELDHHCRPCPQNSMTFAGHHDESSGEQTMD
eukprot:2271515-Prorocentrum_lima.AAC.1